MTKRHNEKRRRNLNQQLKSRMKSIDKIGQSRNEAKREMKDFKFGDTVEGIYSITTLQNYTQVAHEFLKWAKENGAGNRQDLQEVISKHGTDYLKYRESLDLSTRTLKRDRAALNKISENDKITYKFQRTSVNDVQRSRNNLNTNNRNFNEARNADLVAFAKGTGGRRADLADLRKEDFVKIDGRLYVNFTQSKGGRDRLSVVREEYRETIENRLKSTSNGEKVFHLIHTNADIHSYRREYAQSLYQDIIADKELKKDLQAQYPPRREQVKSEYYKTQGQDNVFMGLRDDIYLVSQNLGHNRLDVSVNSYLR